MRNVPTSSASRLSAARFRLKARSICSIAWERAADRITSAPGGRRRWTRARIESPPGLSGMMRSIRLSRPGRSSSSCALATSVSRRFSNACRLSGSAGSSSPATVTDRRAPPTRRRRLAPGESPRARAVAAESSAAPGRAMSAVSAAPGGPKDGRRYPRNGPSASGSTPRRWNVRPGKSAAARSASTTGAPGRTAASTRRRRYTSSGRPSGPPTTWWVARPATLSVASPKARRALASARSIETTTATPSAMPRIARPVCQG